MQLFTAALSSKAVFKTCIPSQSNSCLLLNGFSRNKYLPVHFSLGGGGGGFWGGKKKKKGGGPPKKEL